MPELPPENDGAGTIAPIPVTQATLKQRSQELGLVGKLFGSRDHAPINIAGAIVFLGIMGIFVAPFIPQSPSYSAGDMVKLMGSLVLAALTFLGGYLGGGKRD